MQVAVDAWVASGGDEQKEQAVHALLDTPEYAAQSYLARNKPFLTSSKIREFQECAYHARLRYIDEVEVAGPDEDYFVLGSAVDLRLTSGEEAYQHRYAAVKVRNDKAAQDNPGKVLLTGAQAVTVENAVKEFRSREFFPQTPTKRNVLFLLHGLPCKCELDHFDAVRRVIGDIKTTASIITFDPQMYALQMSFYALGIEKRFGEQVSAELFVVDKNKDFSRSHKWTFTHATLQSHYYEIETLAQAWKDSLETGIWTHVDVSTQQGLEIAWRSDFWPTCEHCKKAAPTIL